MDIFICSKCGANLLECGIIEVTTGGVGRTEFSFKDKKAIHGTTAIDDIDDQWITCNSCNADMHDRTAIEIIDAYENDLPHIRNECEVCGQSFVEVECGECQFRGGQCTGIREDKTMCQECCAEDFAETLRNNPLAFLASESV